MAYVFTLSLLTYNITQASSLELDVRSSMIDIQAQVPLIDILRTLSDKTGIILKAGDDLTGAVTVDFKAISVENCIHRLLAGRNYALIYKKTQEDKSIPVELRVVGSGPLRNITLSSSEIFDIDTEPPALDDHMRKYQRKWFKQAFADTKNLPKRISTEVTGDGHEQSGIRITRLAENSVFRKIGRNQVSTAVSNSITFRLQVSIAYNSERSGKAKKKKIHQTLYCSIEERPHRGKSCQM